MDISKNQWRSTGGQWVCEKCNFSHSLFVFPNNFKTKFLIFVYSVSCFVCMTLTVSRSPDSFCLKAISGRTQYSQQNGLNIFLKVYDFNQLVHRIKQLLLNLRNFIFPRKTCWLFLSWSVDYFIHFPVLPCLTLRFFMILHCLTQKFVKVCLIS